MECNCPVCGGQALPLGTLGFLEHFRCRACGWEWSEDVRTRDWPSDGTAEAAWLTPNAATRAADRIDGYDRDDTGESPDY
jgi:rubredoxin